MVDGGSTSLAPTPPAERARRLVDLIDTTVRIELSDSCETAVLRLRHAVLRRVEQAGADVSISTDRAALVAFARGKIDAEELIGRASASSNDEALAGFLAAFGLDPPPVCLRAR